MDDALYQVVQDLVAELEARFPYAAALLSGQSGVHITDTGREQRANEVPPTQGIVFTVYDGRGFVEYATSTLIPDALAREVRGWAATVRPRSGGPVMSGARLCDHRWPNDGGASRPRARAIPRLFRWREAGAGARVQRRAAGARSACRAGAGELQRYHDESVYIGRGRQLEQHLTRTILQVVMAASDGQQVRYHFAKRGGTGGFEIAEIGDDELAQTAEIALRLLEAGHIEPGEYDTISDPSVSGVIAHESFGHGVELDLFPKGRARAAQYLDRPGRGAQRADVRRSDRAGGYGSYFFDDEGELARPTQILQRWRLRAPDQRFSLGDLRAWLRQGERTPNGRRQDVTRKTYARMTNTFFGRGDTDPEEMIAGVERGIYLRMAESGMEDPMGWGIQVTAHYGEEIVNGAVDRQALRARRDHRLCA